MIACWASRRVGLEAGEMMAAAQTAMIGRLPFTALRDAIFAHPTAAEGLEGLLRAARRVFIRFCRHSRRKSMPSNGRARVFRSQTFPKTQFVSAHWTAERERVAFGRLGPRKE